MNNADHLIDRTLDRVIDGRKQHSGNKVSVNVFVGLNYILGKYGPTAVYFPSFDTTFYSKAVDVEGYELGSF